MDKTQNNTDSLTLNLNNGKKLGFAIYGNPEGIPILAHHGNPGSRLFWGLLPVKQLYDRYWIISPDRPGYGLSDHYEKNGLLEWPSLVIELLDHLKIDRFFNIGVSGGCPFALSCLGQISDRIINTALVSPLGPFLRDSVGDMNINKALFRFIPLFPWIFKLQFKLTARLIKRNPDSFIQLFKRKVEGPDREIMEDKTIMDLFKSDFLEAYRNGEKGSYYDCFIPKNWPINLERISNTVDIWYGDKDRSIGDMGRYLAGKIPNSVTHVIPNQGHFLILSLSPEIFQNLTKLGS